MRKIFWDNPYQHHLLTRVCEVRGNRILLDETIAFSFSGGQESDEAYIHGMRVLDSEIDGNLIYYILQDGHGLVPGLEVRMEINWPRRYRLMRLHFAAELILELATRKLTINKIGAHISETKARIDFFYDKNIAWIFDSVLAEYNKIIVSNVVIHTGFSNVLQQKRFWEIKGFGKVACGGTHAKSTGEIGFVALKRINLGKCKERIEIRLVKG